MAQESKISWTHGTFNPWWGCVKVSPACQNCYAERDSNRFAPGLWGKDAPRRFFGDKHWNEPLRWNAKAQRDGKPFRVFCASMADVFEDRRDLDASRARLWDLIEKTPFLTWLILTKRPELMTTLSPARWASAWPANVWAMTTVENQDWAERRIPYLLRVPAVVRGLSVEPMVGPVSLRGTGHRDFLVGSNPINWVISGGESGTASRPLRPDWLRLLRDECQDAGVPYHIKQWGEWAPYDPIEELAGKYEGMAEALEGSMVRVGKKAAGRTLDGRIWDEYPMGQGSK